MPKKDSAILEVVETLSKEDLHVVSLFYKALFTYVLFTDPSESQSNVVVLVTDTPIGDSPEDFYAYLMKKVEAFKGLGFNFATLLELDVREITSLVKENSHAEAREYLLNIRGRIDLQATHS